MFLSGVEFSELHEIDGRQMMAQIDENELQRRNSVKIVDGRGIYRRELLIYVRAGDYGSLPKVGRLLLLDGERYTVTAVTSECGMYGIYLEAVRA